MRITKNIAVVLVLLGLFQHCEQILVKDVEDGVGGVHFLV